VSFGTWIAMQLLMRRPEVEGFICVAPPSNLYDFSFLAPCPSSGLMINGDKDRVVPSNSVGELSQRLKTQRGIKITHQVVPGANHFFENKTDDLKEAVGAYVDARMEQAEIDRAKDKEREREKERERQRQREIERAEESSGVGADDGGDAD
jgi:alpha/beta superfamily hydrolase